MVTKIKITISYIQKYFVKSIMIGVENGSIGCSCLADQYKKLFEEKPMKKSYLKAIALMVTVVLVMSMSVGCGSSSNSTQNQSTVQTSYDSEQKSTVEKDKELEGTLKFAFPGDKTKGQNEVMKYIENKLALDGMNLKLDFTFIPWDQYWNKIALIAAGGEDYDITMTHISMLGGLVAKQVLSPIDDALKVYGQDLLNNIPNYSFRGTQIGGKTYAVPRTVPLAESNDFTTIRGDLRKKYNIPEIKTIADMDKYYAEIAKNNPDMVVSYSDGLQWQIREEGPVQIMPGATTPLLYVDPLDSTFKVKSFLDSEKYITAVKKKREWFLKGYIPADPKQISGKVSVDVTNVDVAFDAGKLANTWSTLLRVTERIDAVKAKNPDAEMENVFLVPEKPRYIFNIVDNMLSIFSTSKKVNESIAFLNWTRKNQENFDLWSYGIKDVNYKLDGDAVSIAGISDDHLYIPINWAFNDTRFTRYSKYISKEEVQKLKDWDKNAIISKLAGFVFNEESIKTEMTQMRAIYGEYNVDLSTGRMDPDKAFPELSKKLKAGGIDKLIAEAQKQVNDFVANNKK